MREDELLNATRVEGRLNTGDTDYTDARLRLELNDTLQSVFGASIVAARAGAWLKQIETTTTAARTRYRIPARLYALESVELIEQSIGYEVIGDQVVFDTAPPAGSTLRFTGYARPSALVQYQTTGIVTAVDTVALTVTLADLPTDRVLAATILTGSRVDIVHAKGWHELALIDTVASIAGTTLTFATGTELTDVEVGDYCRAADQTDWPCLQDGFHRALADMTAARVLRARGYLEKAVAIEQQAASDLARFQDVLEPRVKDASIVPIPRNILLRRRGMRGKNPNYFQW